MGRPKLGKDDCSQINYEKGRGIQCPNFSINYVKGTDVDTRDGQRSKVMMVSV